MVDGVIVLYEQNETNFTSNGLGYLSDVTECTVSEELNGEYELEMEYPVDGIRYSEIQHRRILYVKPNPYEDPQPFRIYNINRPIDGRVEINARHISYDLSGYTVSESENKSIPFSTSPKMFCEKIPSAMTELNSGMPTFTFWTNSVEEYDSETYAEEGDELKEKHWIFIDTPSSVRSLIGQFTEKYKGEFKFDKYAVKFYGPVSGQSEDDKHYRGTDSGVVLRYGKNLTDLMQEEDSDKGMYTHLYPYWSGTVNTTNTDSESDGSSSSTTTYSSHSEEKVVTMTNKLYPIFDHDVGYKRVLIYEVNSDWNEKHPNNTDDATPWPSEEDFEELCKEYIKNNELGAPKITLTASFVQLSRSAEYEDLKPLEKVLLGDTVSVLWEDLGVNSTLKCTSTEYDALTDSYKSITLGNDANASISSTVAATSSGLSGVASSMSDKVSKEEFYNQTYDTALSTTSTNAVQNKVVTSKFNSVDKTCNSFKNEITNILSIVENLNPSGGAAISYGYSLPTGGNNGDAYVQITSTPKDPRAVVSVSNTHNNFEVSNFKRNGDKYDFDITGTVDEDSGNYAVINVGNLTPGAEYKVKMRLSHDVPRTDLNVSYWQYQGGHWNKAFGIFVGQQDICYNYGRGQGGTAFENLSASCNPASLTDPQDGPSCNYNPYGEGFFYQGIYKDISDREYTFYFTATNTSAGLSFELDDVTDGKNCNFSIKNMEVVYVGTPVLQKDWGRDATLYCPYAYNDNWSGGYGMADAMLGLAWTAWGGVSWNGTPTPYGLTFNTPKLIDRMRLNVSETTWAESADGVNPRKIKIEGSKDSLAIDDPEKEWAVITDNEFAEIDYPLSYVDHVYIDVARDTYNNLRLTYTNPVDGKLSAWQMFAVQEQEDEIFIKDLFFKVEGEWKKYPRGGDEGDIFTYGTEDPSSETQGDIYAKLTNDAIDSISYKVDNAWLLGPSGGGSGGGGITRETIWTGTASSGNVANTTTKPITDYDLLLCYHWDAYTPATSDCEMHLFLVDPKHIANSNYATNQWDGNFEFSYYSTQYIRGKFTDSTTFYITQNNQGGCIARIDGIKFSGGGGGACYNLIDPPITSGNSGMFGSVTATSSLNSNFGPGTAFNGIQADPSNGRNGWLSTESDQSPTLTLAFNAGAKILNFVKLEILNNGSAYCWDPIYIEGSNDGSAWTNILKTGQSVVFDLAANRYSYYNIELNGNKYSHFRIRGAEPFYKITSGYPACIFSNVLIYGSDYLDNGRDGYTHLDLSTATLSAFRPSYGLPTYSNGVVNLPNHNVGTDYNAVASTNLIDLTNITKIKVTYNIKSMGSYKPVVGIGDSNVLPVEDMSSRWGPIINVGYSFVNTSQLNQRVTFNWDVTSYTGSHYICAAVDEYTEMDVYDIAYK